MKKIVSKSRTITKSKVLLKIVFSKKFFKSINDIRQGFNYNFISFEETKGLFIGNCYELIKTLQKKKVRIKGDDEKKERKFTQFLSHNESIILRYEPVIENIFVKIYFVDIKMLNKFINI